MEYFPFFVDIEGKNCLVVGGGRIAQAKIEKLMSYHPVITVVAPEISEKISSIGELKLIKAEFSDEHLHGQSFVIAATDSRTVNSEIARLCRARGIPINAVDSREDCSFIFPALVHHGALSVGISTGGASPTAAAWLKEQIIELLPENIDVILDGLDAMRPQIKLRVAEEKQRAIIYRRLLIRSIELGKLPTDTELERIIQNGDIAP